MELHLKSTILEDPYNISYDPFRYHFLDNDFSNDASKEYLEEFISEKSKELDNSSKLYQALLFKQELSDLEFYRLVTSLYNFDFETSDLVKYFEFKNKKKYQEKLIKLDFAFKGLTKVFNVYVDALCQQTYYALVSEDCQYDFSQAISPSELNALIDAGQVYLIGSHRRRVDPQKEHLNILSGDNCINFETYKDYSVFHFLNGELEKINPENLKFLLSLFRSNFDNSTLLEDLGWYITEENAYLSMYHDRISKMTDSTDIDQLDRYFDNPLVKKRYARVLKTAK